MDAVARAALPYLGTFCRSFDPISQNWKEH